jgi:hypothetical protein
MLGQALEHRRAQHMRHIEHHGVGAPALDKRLQLILKVFGLLSRQSRHRIRSTKPLPRHPVTGFAIGDLGVEFLFGNGGVALVLRLSGCGDDDYKGCRQKQGCNTHQAALPMMATLCLAARFDPVEFFGADLIRINVEGFEPHHIEQSVSRRSEGGWSSMI